MDHYITGAAIKALRERCGLTQTQLADQLCVSDKTVSKWETGRGLPDITLLEPLAAALHVSLPELLSGEVITNANRSANLLRSRLYVCPICGNILPARRASAAAASLCPRWRQKHPTTPTPPPSPKSSMSCTWKSPMR